MRALLAAGALLAAVAQHGAHAQAQDPVLAWALTSGAQDSTCVPDAASRTRLTLRCSPRRQRP